MPSSERPKFRDWPANAPEEMPSSDVQKMYERGFAGCEFREHRVREAHDWYCDYIDSQGNWSDASGESAAYRWGIVGSGAGKLSAPWTAITATYPGCLPGPAQQRGSCVAHGQKNSNLGSCCSEVVWGTVDQVTGTIESAPVISAEGIRNGAFSTEAIYWYRGSNSDGWYCPASAAVSTTKAGCVVRREYEEANIDLTVYSGRLEGLYGRTPPPSQIADALDDHLIRTSTSLSGVEQLIDFMANGYCVNSCGGEGFSTTRDENGVSPRRGSWSHAMAYLGVDARPWVQQKYNEPALVLVQNSWARFNSGPRKVYDSNLMIPEGSFWAKWSDVSRRNMMAMSSVAGWPPKKLKEIIPAGLT